MEKFLNDLQALLDQKVEKDVVYLNNSTCPEGMKPCDDNYEDCPENNTPLPSIYTSDGYQCYTEDTELVERDNLRNIVNKISKLVDTIKKVENFQRVENVEE